MKLPKCKYCKEHNVPSKYGPEATVVRDTWTLTAFVKCSCGAEVSITRPLNGDETPKQLRESEYEMKSYVASIWTTINI